METREYEGTRSGEASLLRGKSLKVGASAWRVRWMLVRASLEEGNRLRRLVR
jgi:hypothetical protein